MSDDGRPILDRDGDGWALIIPGKPSQTVRFTDRNLANDCWQAATWAYHNGAADRMNSIRQALGFDLL